MTSPLPPRSRATDASGTLIEPAGNDSAIVNAGDTETAPGWDPYEVWRTRVFVAQLARYKKDRGNT